MPGLLASFAEEYNLELGSTNVEVRIVDDLTGDVLKHVADSSLLLQPEIPRAQEQARVTTPTPAPPAENINSPVTSGDLSVSQRNFATLTVGLDADQAGILASTQDWRQLVSRDDLTLPEQGVKSAILAQDHAVAEALTAAGWELVDDGEPQDLERSAKWVKGPRQIYREAHARDVVYVGCNGGVVLPLFNVTDDFTAGPSKVAEQIQAAAIEHWPDLKTRGVSLPVDEDEGNAEEIIDREWRGGTLAELLDAEGRFSTPVNRATSSFSALAKVESEKHHSLSRDERLGLLSFQGWGGIAQKVRVDSRTSSKNWDGRNIAKSLGMSEGDYNRTMLAARLESYYTHGSIIKSVWHAVMRAGVPVSGRFVEPGCGSGLFFVGAPEDVQRHGRLVGIECDKMAARLARANAPDAKIIEGSYERVVLDDQFDAAVGNVPFGETIITDSRYPQAQHIHDYFIVRTMDHLKPGGIMAVMTSSGTMDKKDASVRKQIMERANLVAAFRLPSELFSDQGASVTTDILILQRRPAGTRPDSDYSSTGELVLPHKDVDESFEVNQYFLDNPDNVLGNFEATSSAFGPKLTVSQPIGGVSHFQFTKALGEQLVQRIDLCVAEGLAKRQEWLPAEEGEVAAGVQSEEDYSDAAVLSTYDGLIGDYTLVDGVIHEILNEVDQFDDDGVLTGTHIVAGKSELSERDRLVITQYVPLRDAARYLIKQQLGGSDQLLAEAQSAAQGLYKAFVAEFGPVNSDRILRSIGDDPGCAEVCALEIWNEDSKAVEALSDTFTARVVSPEGALVAETAVDAFYLSIDRLGRVDLDWMQSISGIAVEQLKLELGGSLIFVDPLSNKYISGLEYLSGNVVQKLEEARQADALNNAFGINVKALLNVQPDAIPFEDITIRIGSNWIPVEQVSKFAASLFGREEFSERDLKIRYTAGIAQWSVDASSTFKNDYKTQRTSIWGSPNASFETLLEKLLNNQRPSHYDKINGKSVLNDEATLESRAKQDEINDAFYSWVAMDADRVSLFSELYNRANNNLRLPVADGSRITFPGLSPLWIPRKHQYDMVALAMMGYNTMAAHAVGAGKTFEMIAIAMKLGQLGMHKKPLIAVPNHMLGQISREAKQMYPGARILMVTAEDLKGSKRKRFLAIARNNKWDIVVCTHSLLNQISATIDVQLEEYDKQLAIINMKMEEADSTRVERTLQARYKTVSSQRDQVKDDYDNNKRTGTNLCIDELGIDSICVDEAHLYKNLALNSGMNVLGVTNGGSARAFNIFMLGQYLRKLHGKSFGLNFFTGTPIANTMCEMYVHNLILRPEILESMGIVHFDEWANRFGSVVTSLEALPEGGGFRVNERFAKFVNLPEMIRLFRTFADVKTKESLNLPTPNINMNIISVEQSVWQKAFMKHLSIRAIKVRKGLMLPTEDNMLSIATAGRKASLDMRLVSPILPDDSSNKLEEVAKNILEMWEITHDVKGTQLVFMDLGTPGAKKPFTCYDELKRLLVAKGIPAKDIEFVHSAKTAEAKESLFTKVRAGTVRVLVGSTEKMGVGTNVQERMCVLHNVDCPWRPADIAQRQGRIDRQGNLFFKDVKVFRYTTKDSFDLFMWQTNMRKAEYTNQALADPSMASREVSEGMDLGFAEVMAVTTGNPRIREKVEVDDKVNKLERKYKAWLGDRANKMMAGRNLNRDIAAIEQRLLVEEKIEHALRGCGYKHVTVSGAVSEIQSADTTWLYATSIGSALLPRMNVAEAKLMRSMEDIYPLKAKLGGIELVMYRNQYDNFEVRGKLDGVLLPVNAVRHSKSEQVIGRGLREWFDTKARTMKLQDELAVAVRGLAALGVIGEDEWPHFNELREQKANKAELDAWFSKQDYNSEASGPDLFLEMLHDLQESLNYGEDALERVDPEIVDSNDLFSERGGSEAVVVVGAGMR